VVLNTGAGAWTITMSQDLRVTASPSWVDVTLTGTTANALIYGDAGKSLTSLPLFSAQTPAGVNASAPVAASWTGANGISVSYVPGLFTVNQSQDLSPGGNPSFNSITVTGATANTFAFFGAAKQLQSGALSDGEIWVGNTGTLPSHIIPTTANGALRAALLFCSWFL